MADPSKTGASNVRKGKTHERRVANLLTAWSGVPFRRRRVEGRDSSVIERESTADVIPVTGDILFSIEAKSGKGFSIDGMLANPIGNIFGEWWFQTCYDAFLLSSVFKRKFYPMLFFKPHPNFDWVAIDQEPFKSRLLRPIDGSETKHDIWFPHMACDMYAQTGPITKNVSHTKKAANKVMVELQLATFYLCRWRDIEKNIHPESIFIAK